jgi:FMN phosphatase YigB (HAD superfamily)
LVAVLHAFYLEGLDDMLDAVASLDEPVTVAVSVASPSAARRARRAIRRRLGRSAQQHVVVVENRGRNFAPLVVSMADVVRAHEFVVHLHSKRSAYSSVGDPWRQHLLAALSGENGRSALATLRNEPAVGLVMPTRWPGLSVWAQHWLRNAEHGRALYGRLGLDPRLVGGYVDYPVGGMFTARVAALRPLLDLGLRFDDFEPEDAQIDGTLAHALERCVAAAPGVAGFGVLELDPINRSIGPVRQRLSERYGHDLAALAAEPPDVDLLSVDLFDTLNLRPVLDPAVLQHFAARSAVRQPGAADEALRTRRQLEAALRAEPQRSGDVSVDDIVAAVGGGSVADLIAHERSIETRAATLDPHAEALVRACRQRGSRVVLMSDTTLTRNDVDALLSTLGVAELFDELYVSSDVGARKDNGTMWEMVAQRERVAAARWAHLGDNEVSDLQAATDRGICALHAPSARGWLHYVDPTASAQWGEEPSAQAVAGLGLVAARHGVARAHRFVGDVDRFGYAVLGPLVWTYLSHLLHSARQLSSPFILWSGRDMFTPLRAAAAATAALGGKLPDGGYFRVSRTAALAAAQGAAFRPDLVVDSGHFHGTTRQMIAARLGLHVEGDDRLDDPIFSVDDRQRCLDLLADHRDVIVAHGTVERAALFDHLAELGVGEHHHLVLADLGYSATAQRALDVALDRAVTGVYAATMVAARPAADSGSRFHGVFADFYVDPAVTKDQRHVFLLREDWLVEALLSEGAAGTTLFSTRTTAPEVFNDPEHRRLAVQAEVVRFCVDMAEVFGAAALDDPPSATLVDHYLNLVVGDCFASLPTMFAGLTLDVGFNHSAQSVAQVFPG